MREQLSPNNKKVVKEKKFISVTLTDVITYDIAYADETTMQVIKGGYAKSR